MLISLSKCFIIVYLFLSSFSIEHRYGTHFIGILPFNLIAHWYQRVVLFSNNKYSNGYRAVFCFVLFFALHPAEEESHLCSLHQPPDTVYIL